MLGLVGRQAAVLVLAPAAARTGGVACDPRSERLCRRRFGIERDVEVRVRVPVYRFRHVEVGERIVRNSETHFEVVVVEVRLAHRRERVRREDRRVLENERSQRQGAGGDDLDVPLDDRAQGAVRVAALHHGIRVRAVDPPAVRHRLAPHRRRQIRDPLVHECQVAGGNVGGAAVDVAALLHRHVQKRIEALGRREDEHAAPPARRAGDHQRGAVDVQRGDVHPQQPGIGDERPWLHREQRARRREQAFDRGGRHAPPGEVAFVLVPGRHRLDELGAQVVELRRRGDRDGDGALDRCAHRGGDDGVRDADGVGAARCTGRGLRQRFAKHAPDGAVDVLRA